MRRLAAIYWPRRVEEITGVPEAAIVETAQLLGGAAHSMILTSRGPEQQSQGVNNTLAYINVALALGAVGRALSGYGCVTGQSNGQGGREHGQKADQLPGYRRIDDEQARTHLADIWGLPAEILEVEDLAQFRSAIQHFEGGRGPLDKLVRAVPDDDDAIEITPESSVRGLVDPDDEAEAGIIRFPLGERLRLRVAANGFRHGVMLEQDGGGWNSLRPSQRWPKRSSVGAMRIISRERVGGM